MRLYGLVVGYVGYTISLRGVKMAARSTQQLEKLFDAKPVIVLEEMQKALGSASRATIFRLLVKVSYCRSYNYNGKYYTKHDLTRYDKQGLFSYKGILFSRDGNLNATLTRLIRESSFGHTQRELQELLQVRVQTSLLKMVHHKQLARSKVAGQFIYLHPDSEIRVAQLAKRQELFEQRRFELKEVTDAVVIQVLLMLIWHPSSRTGDVARRLKGHSPPITIQHVRVVFDRYGLDNVGEKGGPSRH